MRQMTVVVDLSIIAAFFVFAVLMSREGPRARMLDAARAFAMRHGRPEHTPAWEQEHAELWLMARRKQLVEDLDRIERLLLHDQNMSATRQLGNRLARDQLIASLARIPDLLPGRDRYLAYDIMPSEPRPDDRAAPSPVMAARGDTVEVLEVGGWRR